MKISYSVVSNIGKREINEDNCLALSDGSEGCFLVADGLGGHDLGEVASKLVAEAFFDMYEQKKGLLSPNEFLNDAFVQAQNYIMNEQREKKASEKMKSTGVALFISASQLAWGHVGDSRLYAFAHGRIKKRTLDHSVPQMLVLAGDIKEKEIRHHPDRNRLLKVLGIPWDTPKQEVSKDIPVKKYQAFLLCTDGFWELIDEKTMEVSLKKSKTVEEWLSMMNAEVQKNGFEEDMDNNTAIAVWIEK